MAYKVALLCLLLTVGCCSVASARTLTAESSGPVSCFIWEKCGWTPTSCDGITPKAPTSGTPVDLIVQACVDAILIGKIKAVAVVFVIIKLLIKIDISLCVAVIVALIASVSVGAVVVAKALAQACLKLNGALIIKLILGLKLKVLLKLCLALGVKAGIILLLPLFKLISLGNLAFIQLLANCCNKLFSLNPGWAGVIAQACIKITADVALLLLKLLDPACVLAVLKACLPLEGGLAFVCACAPVLEIALSLLGLGVGACLLG